MQRIYISGSIGYDEIMDFPGHFKDYFHPEKLHQINVSFAVESLEKHLGGIATNIAYSLRQAIDYLNVISTEVEKSQSLRSLDSKKQIRAARDDKYTISPVGAVGKDGGLLLDFFTKNNIDTTYVRQDNRLYTATGRVITDRKDNQIWGFYYGAASLNIQMKKYPNEEIKKNSKNNREFWVLSATHERPFTSVLKHVIKNKLPYLFDPGMTLTWIRDDLLKKGVLNATYLVGNDYEIAMIEKRVKMTVAEIVKKGVNVITTLGSEGVKLNFSTDSVSDFLPVSAPSKLEDARVSGIPLAPRHLSKIKNIKSLKIKAVKLKKVVDPTGAGDAWRGGFVGALVSGKPIQECLIMGNVMASFAVECVGTVEYQVSVDEIKRRVKSISKS